MIDWIRRGYTVMRSRRKHEEEHWMSYNIFVEITLSSTRSCLVLCAFNPVAANPVKALHFATLV